MKSCKIWTGNIRDSDSLYIHKNFLLPNGVRHYVPREVDLVINGNFFEVETYDIERPGQGTRRRKLRPGRVWRQWGSQHKSAEGLPRKVRRYRIRHPLPPQVLAWFDYDLRIQVVELGEDGDQWLVTGTGDAHSAEVAVRKYVLANQGETLESNYGYSVEFGFKYRQDWAWVEDPSGRYDEILVNGEESRGKPRFAGFKVTL